MAEGKSDEQVYQQHRSFLRHRPSSLRSGCLARSGLDSPYGEGSAVEGACRRGHAGKRCLRRRPICDDGRLETVRRPWVSRSRCIG
jgi:hypothetical protein